MAPFTSSRRPRHLTTLGQRYSATSYARVNEGNGHYHSTKHPPGHPQDLQSGSYMRGGDESSAKVRERERERWHGPRLRCPAPIGRLNGGASTEKEKMHRRTPIQAAEGLIILLSPLVAVRDTTGRVARPLGARARRTLALPQMRLHPGSPAEGSRDDSIRLMEESVINWRKRCFNCRQPHLGLAGVS